MKLARRITSIVLLLVAAGLVSLALIASHDSPCAAAPAVPAGAAHMKAIVHRCYGNPDVLRLEEMAKPVPADAEMLVRVHAASVNPLDWHYLEGVPYLVRLLDSGVGSPDNPRLGVDFAGTVEAVGKKVTRFKPGDEVFGGKFGAFAEYVSFPEERAVVAKPAGLSFEQAAAIPIAGVTALQALRDKGRLQPGQKVLVIGASGGVGTFAVQLARSFGAEVTGVCSTRNLELVRQLGADHVIDYTREDVLKRGLRYELILDNVGARSLADLFAFRRIMTPKGIYILIGGGGPEGRWVGGLSTFLDTALVTPFVSQAFVTLLADLNQKDLTTLGEMMETGKLTAVIDRRYRLSEAPAALHYLEAGHARGKVILSAD